MKEKGVLGAWLEEAAAINYLKINVEGLLDLVQNGVQVKH